MSLGVLFTSPTFAIDLLPGRPSGAATDPLSIVRFSDVRAGHIELLNDNEIQQLSVQGAYVFDPTLKINYDVNYQRKKFNGSRESDFKDLRIQPIYFPKTLNWGGVIYRPAVGLELRIDYANIDDAIGTGVEQLGALVGLQVLLSRRNRMTIIVDHRRSISGRPLTQSEMHLVAVHSITRYDVWGAVDFSYLVNHDRDDAFVSFVNIQVGHLFTKAIGVHLDYAVPLAGQDQFDYAIRATLRFLY